MLYGRGRKIENVSENFVKFENIFFSFFIDLHTKKCIFCVNINCQTVLFTFVIQLNHIKCCTSVNNAQICTSVCSFKRNLRARKKIFLKKIKTFAVAYILKFVIIALFTKKFFKMHFCR